MTPPIRIHDALYVPHLRCLYYFGATPRIADPSSLTVQFKKDGRVLSKTQSGVHPVTPGLDGLLHSDVVFLESGLFYGAVLDVDGDYVDEVTAGFSGSTLVRRREVRVQEWRPEHVELSAVVASELDASAVDALTRASQLRILALSALVWMKRNPSKLGSIDDLRASQVGEAFRKSVMKSLSIPLLTAKVPATHTEQDSAYSKRFDLLGDALEHNQSSRSVCLADIALNGERSWSNTNLGHNHFGRQEIAEADGFYLQAARLLQRHGQRNIHYNNGVFTWRSHAFSKAIEGLHDSPKSITLPDLDPSLDRASLVHLLGCDDSYFKKYGNMCIYSSLRSGPAHVIVHVHVCNPSGDTLTILEGWANREDVMVRFSFEYRDESLTSVPYYTTLRFLVAPAIMRHYNKPLVISDVDMVVNQPWADTLEAIGEADAGYISGSTDEWITEHYGPGTRPWDVAAGTMYFSNSDLGRRFLGYVASYIRTVLTFPKQTEWYLNWGVDQVALRKGVDIVLHPNAAKVRNLRTVRMLRGPLMHMGGKAELAREPAPGPWEELGLS
ncbi:hypothetical protein [Arthrobacter sp. ok362]|uniref:hypothetical protein n=1 Tax=Arthrobacter sp. ok362 TaxID=1761745 RepID=UPI0008866E79|nr:hypothetical protein [Arthrobacter sp. ok362]SDL96769.1 hypothetical protein SAMN04487913_11911 [Arthrobacter sp. ok362]